MLVANSYSDLASLASASDTVVGVIVPAESFSFEALTAVLNLLTFDNLKSKILF